MDITKKLCKSICDGVLSRHRERSGRQLQSLPLEILIRILSYLTLGEVAALCQECVALRVAAGYSLHDQLRSLRRQLRKAAEGQKSQVACSLLDSRSAGLSLLAGLHRSWLLQSELNLLRVLLRPYRGDLRVWPAFTRQLAAIVEESRQASQVPATGLQAQSFHLTTGHLAPSLNRFLNRFIREIDVHFYFSEKFPKFETRLMDLMFSCSCCNHMSIERRSGTDAGVLEIYYDVRLPQDIFKSPDISHLKSRFQNEREILQFMLEYVREANSLNIRTMLVELASLYPEMLSGSNSSTLDKLINFAPSSDEIEFIRRKNSAGDSSKYRFENHFTTDITKWRLTCSFKIKYATDFKIDVSLRENSCSICSHIPYDNNLHISITYEKEHSIREYILYYDSKAGNYAQCERIHSEV